MANKVQIRLNINHQAGSNKYVAGTGFSASLQSGLGPTPGLITAALAGTDVDLTGITLKGGLVHVVNYDAVNFVTVGAWYPGGNLFFPLFEVPAGEEYVYRLSRYLGETFGAGTGTGVGASVKLRLHANGGPCKVRVAAFEP